MKRDFIAITDLNKDEIYQTFKKASSLKSDLQNGINHHPLAGKTLAMIFQKPSARTRISFEVGMFQLGGHALYLSPSDIGLGKRESVADIARVISRYCDGIMARVFDHNDVVDLAKFASVPVINGLSDLLHPCQVMGDLLTIMENKEMSEQLIITYVGDGNNLANSWLNMASIIPMTLRLAIPEGYDPDPEILNRANRAGVSAIEIFRDPQKSMPGTDVIYTDVWASMGQEDEAKARQKVFEKYQINESLVSAAKDDCVVMHCLPAHRGDEITDEVMDGPHSIVFDQAENRLHIQKAIMIKLMAKD